MATSRFVTVTAPEGRRTPVHSEDGAEPGGAQLCVTVDDVALVRYSHTTIRSINRGDLILCDMNGSIVQSVEAAEAPGDGRGKWPRVRSAEVAEALAAAPPVRQDDGDVPAEVVEVDTKNLRAPEGGKS
jgi:hypothetical protein